MSQNADKRTDFPDTDEEVLLKEMAEGRPEPKPVGFKLLLASVLLLAFVGYLIYVALSDPRGPPLRGEFFKSENSVPGSRPDVAGTMKLPAAAAERVPNAIV